MSTALDMRSGVVFDLIDATLHSFDEYAQFRAGHLSRADYCSWVTGRLNELREVGLNDDQLFLSTRFPVDERGYVAEILQDLHTAGMISSADYPEAEFHAFKSAVAARFTHDRRTTYIFPEEARLLFALAHIAAPASTVFLGSYYGYWAIWAMPGIIAAGGRATLVDLDARVIDSARRNFAALGVSAADFLVADATIRSPELPRSVDMYVLDAEGPKEGVLPDLQDKAIYYPIMQAHTASLSAGGLLVAHNMLLHNLTDNAYFSAKIAANTAQYGKFHSHLDDHYDCQRTYPTSEGVGIYRKSSTAAVQELMCAE